MKVELTEREKDLLVSYADVYESERNKDFTCEPIVVVEESEYLVAGDGYQDCFIYILDFGDEKIEAENITSLKSSLLVFSELSIDEIDKVCRELETADEFEHPEFTITVVPVHKVWKPVAYFFTREQAEKYIEYQKHNLKSPRIYTRSAGYSNSGDFPVFQKLLLKMGTLLKEEE